MRDPIINNYNSSDKPCKCGAEASKEIITRDLHLGIQYHFYCSKCFEEYKHLNSSINNIAWTREKLIGSGMDEEEVEKAIKEIFKK